MIYAKLEKLVKYINISDREKIEHFLEKLSPDMEEGRYEIDGERIYARVMQYDTSEADKCKIEAHDIYIDIQASISGSEGIDVFDRAVLKEKDQNKAKDATYYEANEASIIAHCNNIPGYFTMLLPEDAHRPQIRTNTDDHVKKIVIKMNKESLSTYSVDYYDKIVNGLERAIVTDGNNNVLTMDEGIEIWSEKAKCIENYSNGLLFFCGNGASASMAEHMSHDWFQNAAINTLTCSEVSHITAISNDQSYDDVYSYRVERVLSKNDILVGISSSGNSPNIVNAVNAAKKNGAYTITVSGKKTDNAIRKMGDLNFYVPLETYGEVESAHAVLLHCALDYYLDKYKGGRH